FVGSAVSEACSGGGSTASDPGTTEVVQCKPPSVDFRTSSTAEEGEFPAPLMPGAGELPAGADGQREWNLLPGLTSVERGSSDDVLEGPLEPSGDDVVWIDRVHHD